MCIVCIDREKLADSVFDAKSPQQYSLGQMILAVQSIVHTWGPVVAARPESEFVGEDGHRYVKLGPVDFAKAEMLSDAADGIREQVAGKYGTLAGAAGLAMIFIEAMSPMLTLMYTQFDPLVVGGLERKHEARQARHGKTPLTDEFEITARGLEFLKELGILDDYKKKSGTEDPRKADGKKGSGRGSNQEH